MSTFLCATALSITAIVRSMPARRESSEDDDANLADRSPDAKEAVTSESAALKSSWVSGEYILFPSKFQSSERICALASMFLASALMNPVLFRVRLPLFGVGDSCNSCKSRSRICPSISQVYPCLRNSAVKSMSISAPGLLLMIEPVALESCKSACADMLV